MHTTSQTTPPAGPPIDILSHPTRDDRRVDLDGQVTVHYPDLGDTVTERTQNVSVTGMFIRTPSLRPPGTVLEFELDLANGLEAIEGHAEVVWVRRQDDGLFRPAGMGVRFLGLDKESMKMIRWSVTHRTRELRKILHLDTVEARPVPVSDLDALRMELEDALGDGADGTLVRGRKRGESSALAELRAEVDSALQDVLETGRGDSGAGSSLARAQVEYLRGDADPYTLHPYAGCATASPPERTGSQLWRFASVPLASLAALGIYLLSPVSEPASATPQPAIVAQALPAEPPELVPLGLATAETATAPSEAGAAAEDPPSVEEDLERLTWEWAAAWSEQRARAYLAFYASGFQPPKGLARAAWEAQREERILKPRQISVEVSDLETEVLAPNRARVSFDQSYRSDRYRDTVRKTFELVRGEYGWQILTESSQPAA